MEEEKYNFNDWHNSHDIEKELVKAFQEANKEVAKVNFGSAFEYLKIAQKCMDALQIKNS